MEGQGPLITGISPQFKNKNYSENIMHNKDQSFKVHRSNAATTNVGISHKRSVSDGIFNNVIPTNKLG